MQTYLARLCDELDSSTLKATLGLMLQECRAAIDKQRSLIALERLGRRHSPVRLAQLQALEQTYATVVAALRAAERDMSALDAVVMGEGNVVQLGSLAH